MTCPAISSLSTRKWVRVLQLRQELSASVRQVASIIQQAAITATAVFNPVQRYASSPMMVLRNENNFKGYGGLIVIVTRTRTASAVCTREITGVDGANENR